MRNIHHRSYFVGLCVVLSACHSPVEDQTSAQMNAMNEAIANATAAMSAADELLNSENVKSQGLSNVDLARVCRATLAKVMGRDPSIIKVTNNEAGIVSLRYNRPDDGKQWKNDCRVEGNRAIWRAVDAFPGSGAGRWRTGPEDEVLTYSINGKAISITEKFADGSGATEAFTIAK